MGEQKDNPIPEEIQKETQKSRFSLPSFLRRDKSISRPHHQAKQIVPQPSSVPTPVHEKQTPSTHREINNGYQEGRYLGLLTTYKVPWDEEKTARDVWQNFFDGNNYTLDGVNSSIHPAAEGAVFSIQGASEYDYRHLLHLGGSTKTENTLAAGGFGEGSAIAALVMLRDMGAKEIVHESGDWRLTFYLDEIPDYKAGEAQAKGLFAKVEKVPYQKGSRFRVEFPNPETAKLFAESRDLFYHSENSDFQNPTYVNPAFGGVKLHVGEKGNVYEAGQRRQFKEYGEEKGKSYNVADVTLWTREKVFDPDRDRSGVDQTQVTNKVIRELVATMGTEDIKRTITEHPELWYKTESLRSGNRLLQEMCSVYKYQKQGEPITFPSNYIAFDLGIMNFRAELEAAGYIICDTSLANVGMITGSERYLQMQEHKRLEPTEKEQQRIEVLQEFTQDVLSLDTPQIWMFSKKDEQSIVHGQHTRDFLWMSQEAIRGEFTDALETYLHEISHGSGRGHDTQFAYTLDTNIKKALSVMTRILKDKQLRQKVEGYVDRWDKAKEEANEQPS